MTVRRAVRSSMQNASHDHLEFRQSGVAERADSEKDGERDAA